MKNVENLKLNIMFGFFFFIINLGNNLRLKLLFESLR